jgi:hypothetical protein|tara:strand:- start:4565 stop:4828 length:264 start_codon:yes stop_codon:yes gene_type:complete
MSKDNVQSAAFRMKAASTQKAADERFFERVSDNVKRGGRNPPGYQGRVFSYIQFTKAEDVFKEDGDEGMEKFLWECHQYALRAPLYR